MIFRLIKEVVHMYLYCVSYIDQNGDDACIEVYAYTTAQAEFLAREELPGCQIISADRVAIACG